MSSMAGKVAIVTGASAGIGRATAIAFGKAGATVVIVARRADKGAETVQLVNEAGGAAPGNDSRRKSSQSPLIEGYG